VLKVHGFITVAGIGSTILSSIANDNFRVGNHRKEIVSNFSKWVANSGFRVITSTGPKSLS